MDNQTEQLITVGNEPQAKRAGTGLRLDLLDGEFIREMAKVLDYGATKYDENNWRKGLPGEKSGANHAMKHLTEYIDGISHDFLNTVESQLAAVAVNAMFEFALVRDGKQKPGRRPQPESEVVTPQGFLDQGDAALTTKSDYGYPLRFPTATEAD